MSRLPQGKGFAQFFPNAPRTKAESRAHTSSDTAEFALKANDASGGVLPFDNSERDAISDGLERLLPETSGSRLPAEDESPTIEIPSTVDSASSHTSSGSSMFSNSALRNITTTSHEASRMSTSGERASAHSTSHHIMDKSQPPTDYASLSKSTVSSRHDSNHRILARDPSAAVLGRKCTYDPLLDRSRSRSSNKHAAPTYIEFGSVSTF